MNTIFWKGVLSTTIDGLIISELPPISKPPLRVKETTIDGRDGSIIEELGYEPYNKPVTIGLRGNFDINKVIKYFTGNGEIIFSNEPDKVYTANVISQIDYNRLLRFRTAVVEFRVQPYKYKHLEAYKEAQTATASGTSIVVTDGANANMKAFSIYGKTTQDGTPTPDAPVELVAVGGEQIQISATGKNLLAEQFVGGVHRTTGHEAFPSVISTQGIYLLSGTYVLSVSGVSNCSMFVNGMDDATHTNEYQESYWMSRVITIPRDGLYNLQFNKTDGVAFTDKEIQLVNSTAQLERGTTATAYEPHICQYATIHTQGGMHGIHVESGGNYTDANGQQWICNEIDICRGVYIQRVHEKVFDGTEPWEKSLLQDSDTIIRYDYRDIESPAQLIENVLSAHFPCDGINKSGMWVNFDEAQYAEFRIKWGYSTVGELKAFLAEQYGSGHPVTCLYSLRKPIETPIPEEELALYTNLKPNEPTTITNDASAYMNVEYFKPFEVFNEGLETSKPKMVLRGSGTVEIYVNGEHIFDYTFPEGENEVVIDSEKEDAYLGNVLKNRNMNGEFPTLHAGTNQIEWTGYVESIEILARSRWL